MSIAVPLYGFGASGSPNKSTIIVTAPTGSTVTCKMGSTTKTATEKNGVWKFGGLDLGTWTITSTKGGDSATQDVAITRLTVEYVTIVYRITPEFTYTGDSEIVDDSDNIISDFASWKNNWKIRFLTSGTLTFTNLNGAEGGIDVFLVGGGGGSKGGATGTGGGGGGYTTTANAVSLVAGTAYDIAVGAGGSGDANGGNTSAFSVTASGGSCNNGSTGGNGGSGGGAYQHAQATGECAGGSDGGNGGDSGYGANGGTGQGTTTREFGDSSGKLYAGGGGGSSNKGTNNPAGGAGGGGTGGRYTDGSGGTNGETNTGGGAGGTAVNSTMSGGSGIVVIRNARGTA